MKKIFLCMFFLVLLPTLCSASYIIHLKNGSEILTSDFWKEDKLIKFYYKGGVMGIDRSQITSIENSDQKISAEELPVWDEEQRAVPEQPEPAPEEKSADIAEGPQKNEKSPTEILREQFNQLDKRYKRVNSLAPDELIAFARELMQFRDAVLQERLGQILTKEIESVYKMSDTIESILDSTQR